MRAKLSTIHIIILVILIGILISVGCVVTSPKIKFYIKINEDGSGTTYIYLSGEMKDENSSLEEQKKQLKMKFLETGVKEVEEYMEGNNIGFRLTYEFSDLGELSYQIDAFEKVMLYDVFNVKCFINDNILKTKKKYVCSIIVDYSDFNKTNFNEPNDLLLYNKIIFILKLPGELTSVYDGSTTDVTTDITENTVTWTIEPELENNYYLFAESQVPLPIHWTLRTVINNAIFFISGAVFTLIGKKLLKWLKK